MSPVRGATAVQVFLVFLVLLFFFQDVGNIALLHAGYGNAVPAFSAVKEALAIGFCLVYGVQNLHRLWFRPSAVVLATIVAAVLATYTAVGLIEFPRIGVVYELRTLVMPLVMMLVGWLYGDAVRHRPEQAERLVKLYQWICVVIAISAFIDYGWLGDAFWTEVNLAEIDRLKGYDAVTAGALPQNMYSFFYGRRAFGLAFNPLNLAYVLIPGVVVAWCRRQWWMAALLLAAMVSSWSRQPIAATVVVLVASSISPAMLLCIAALAVPVTGAYLGLLHRELISDPSVQGHFETVAIGLRGLAMSPLGYGIGAAGVFAGNYSELSVESAYLNIANQIGIPGMIVYIAAFAIGWVRTGPLAREMRLMILIYAITAFMSPHILVIRSTFGFFLLLGVNLALRHVREVQARAARTAADPGPAKAAETAR